MTIPITMAFQPIVDLAQGTIFAHEALVRGTEGQSAQWVLDQVNDDNRYSFDQTCRVKAIEMAAALGMKEKLSVNFLPNAVYQPATCIRTTLETARRTGFPISQIMFEATEAERVEDVPHLRRILTEYKRQGFTTAIDDFGAGFSGLNLLAEFQPDIVKIDMQLTRGIEADRIRRAIVGGILFACREIGITVIAEGIETAEQEQTLREMGISLMQGYRYARPAFAAMADRIDHLHPQD
ncbi:EAL domain-containing protein [Niveispirillum sp. BGYR6]|uniref:EAL domain-containing protein n=1 Tax=Niveispirillum sp. BGYR6 TaxID=2971249 RepID=UPI0022B94CCF|nr:EAL domain-containing protein [Niveispirillum sp. BGYR6]MDG5495081.1 EAL domain-containing protein [Niveispirillum sp. BGYR6]